MSKATGSSAVIAGSSMVTPILQTDAVLAQIIQLALITLNTTQCLNRLFYLGEGFRQAWQDTLPFFRFPQGELEGAAFLLAVHFSMPKGTWKLRKPRIRILGGRSPNPCAQLLKQTGIDQGRIVVPYHPRQPVQRNRLRQVGMQKDGGVHIHYGRIEALDSIGQHHAAFLQVLLYGFHLPHLSSDN